MLAAAPSNSGLGQAKATPYGLPEVSYGAIAKGWVGCGSPALYEGHLAFFFALSYCFVSFRLLRRLFPLTRPPYPTIMADKAGGKPLDEVVVSRAIIETQAKIMMEHMDTDVAIVGAGPAGLTAAACLAGSGLKVSIFERKLGIGGGMLGGGMCFPRYCARACVLLLGAFSAVQHALCLHGYISSPGWFKWVVGHEVWPCNAPCSHGGGCLPGVTSSASHAWGSVFFAGSSCRRPRFPSSTATGSSLRSTRVATTRRSPLRSLERDEKGRGNRQPSGMALTLFHLECAEKSQARPGQGMGSRLTLGASAETCGFPGSVVHRPCFPLSSFFFSLRLWASSLPQRRTPARRSSTTLPCRT